jgi:hypothetical protein
MRDVFQTESESGKLKTAAPAHVTFSNNSHLSKVKGALPNANVCERVPKTTRKQFCAHLWSGSKHQKELRYEAVFETRNKKEAMAYLKQFSKPEGDNNASVCGVVPESRSNHELRIPVKVFSKPQGNNFATVYGTVPETRRDHEMGISIFFQSIVGLLCVNSQISRVNWLVIIHICSDHILCCDERALNAIEQ